LIKKLATGGAIEAPVKGVSMLSSKETIMWKQIKEGLHIQLPKALPDTLAVGFKIYF